MKRKFWVLRSYVTNDAAGTSMRVDFVEGEVPAEGAVADVSMVMPNYGTAIPNATAEDVARFQYRAQFEADFVPA